MQTPDRDTYLAQVPCPQLSLSPTTFTAAASAAVTAAGSSLKAGTVYSPYTSAEGFILGAFIFEDAGVTAYHGAVGALQVSNKESLLQHCAW